MKTIKIPLTVLLIIAILRFFACTVLAADVSVGVEINAVNDFYDPLSSQGYWVEVGSYGRCWHPNYVAASWRPYCEGTWVWTDDGWYWQSDEPWAWACYHYGRWYDDSYYGWVWVPDIEWGPSWVCFREGGGYCGWAPLPPGWRGGVTISADIVPAGWFVFINEHHFGERVHAQDVIVNNVTVINRTTIINKTRATVGNRVIPEGPRVQDLQRVSRARIQTSTVQVLRQREKVPPAVHRATPQPQPAIQRENERQNEPPATEPTEPPQRERPSNNPPGINPGAPNRPASPPPEQKEQNPQHPSGPPPSEKTTPTPPQKTPPPQHEEKREEHGHDNGGEQNGKGP